MGSLTYPRGFPADITHRFVQLTYPEKKSLHTFRNRTRISGSITACIKRELAGAVVRMVYRSSYHGKCRVCQRCRPKHWFRCNLCGEWMGLHCNPRQVPFASPKDTVDNRFEQFEVSLHCYIWTSEAPDRSLRADLCIKCCEEKILKTSSEINATELPAHVKRRILKFISWGSWW